VEDTDIHPLKFRLLYNITLMPDTLNFRLNPPGTEAQQDPPHPQ
jgi:hypothetical protein